MIVLIQIIKWMPPYLYNKALPIPTLTYPILYFQFLIISIILLKINTFPMRYEIWKGRKKPYWDVSLEKASQYQCNFRII